VRGYRFADRSAAGPQGTCQTHQQHRKHEHRFTADAVAETTEVDAAQRARNIAERVNAQCRKSADRWIGGQEEERPEDESGDAGVDEEIIPLDDGADGAGCHDLTRGRLLTRRAGVRFERDQPFPDANHWRPHPSFGEPAPGKKSAQPAEEEVQGSKTEVGSSNRDNPTVWPPVMLMLLVEENGFHGMPPIAGARPRPAPPRISTR
jgi:hypothetical protein